VKGWYGLYAPAATSPAAIAQWNAALRKVLAEREVYARLMAIGLQPKPGSPAELRTAQEAGAAVWAPIVKASGFYLD
jgi:tripartite-type tricarboxylate transporter receptor subunit TctC